MRIGFDIDGTLTDNSSWFQAVERHCGVPYDVASQNYGLPDGYDLHEFLDKEFTWVAENAVPEYGAASICGHLERNHDLYFITARNPIHRITTERWIDKHMLHTRDGSLIFEHDKVKACQEHGIQIMVEDSAENANELARAQILTFLIDRNYNRNVPVDPSFVIRFAKLAELPNMIRAVEMLIGLKVQNQRKYASRKKGKKHGKR